MKSVKSIMLLLLFSFAFRGFSQVAKNDFASINKAYADQEQLSVKVTYQVFRNKTTPVAFSTEKGEVKQKGILRYTRTGDIETVETETYRLIVDHEDKNISLLDIISRENKNEEMKTVSPVELDELIAMCSKVEFKKLNSTQNCYTLIIPDEQYQEVKLIYNAKNFFIEKLILYYSEKQNLEGKDDGLMEAPRVEITYSDFNTHPDFDQTPFSYNSFLEKRNGKLLAKAAYKAYTVNDQLSIK